MNSLNLTMSALLFLAAAAAIFAGVRADDGFPDYAEFAGKPYSVTYDGRSLFFNNSRVLLLSGTIHYPRATPAAWDNLFGKAKADGLNSIETCAWKRIRGRAGGSRPRPPIAAAFGIPHPYLCHPDVFWNAHEHKRGVFDFTDHKNLTLFLDKAAAAGLFVNLRLGPFVCAEWNYGGFPVWINDVPGLSTRTYNPAWLELMANFTERFVDIARPYLAINGGPVYIMQVENEFHPQSREDFKYVEWCGQLADRVMPESLWEMCNGASANNTINSCNDNDCAAFIKDHGQNGQVLISQPAMWTGEPPEGRTSTGRTPSLPCSPPTPSPLSIRERGLVPDVGAAVSVPSRGRGRDAPLRLVVRLARHGRDCVLDPALVRARGFAHELLHVRRRQPFWDEPGQRADHVVRERRQPQWSVGTGGAWGRGRGRAGAGLVMTAAVQPMACPTNPSTRT